MAQGIYKVTEDFEAEICRYTGAPYCVAVDNASNAIFLSLMYEGVKGKEISIPCRTYPSVPCEIIHAGAKVKFEPVEGETLTGAYLLKGSKTVDSALRFTYRMYDDFKGLLVCLSFTGGYKHLKLSKAGAILTDDIDACTWLKRARFSGRRELPYRYDNLDMLGWNFTLMPEIAARGLLLMTQFYDFNGEPISNEDKTLPYPDLSKFNIYTQ